MFGAPGIIVLANDVAQMMELAEALEGQLALDFDDDDLPLAAEPVPILEEKAGRLLANGFTTMCVPLPWGHSPSSAGFVAYHTRIRRSILYLSV